MKSILVVGGAGFIGSNLSSYYLEKGNKVIVFDNLSRHGTRENLRWLESMGKDLEVIVGDIRIDVEKLEHAVNRVEAVFHLAAQVAVTTSVINPKEDFEVNALGTFNILETVRKSKNKPVLVYASTNKVYGSMENINIIEIDGKYVYKEVPNGIREDMLLDFHSPYGCSKGCADQYVRDYARIYNLRTVVFRQSCIYGYRQFGVEDQGWVAWFAIAAMLRKKINIYGDGKQVRDILFIDDLFEAYEKAWQNIMTTCGKVYNIGGGPNNRVSLLELIKILEEEFHNKIDLNFCEWRPGDQRIFFCDISKAKNEFGWEPKIIFKEGVKKLARWIKANKELLIKIDGSRNNIAN